MRKETLLEQEYRRWKTQAAPDLWSRIEGGLTERSERVTAPARQKVVRFSARKICGAATAAAAVLLLLAAGPRFMETVFVRSGDTASVTGAVTRPGTGQVESQAAAAVPAEPGLGKDGVPEMAGAGEEGVPEMAGAGENGVPETDMGVLEIVPEVVWAGGNGIPEADAGGENGVPGMAEYTPLSVPEDAVTVAGDEEYFAEDVLKDTRLLCQVTVQEAYFEEDADGHPAGLVYEARVDEEYYESGTDVRSGELLTVVSPIIGPAGTDHSLYQLQPGGVYLLPLTQRDGGWEMVFPYAPQIQRTGEGQYLFHSGYQDLIDEGTIAVLGGQEGPGDRYDDQMFLREDDEFLSDLVGLIEERTAEEE